MKTYACARKFSGWLLLLGLWALLFTPAVFAQAGVVANWKLDAGIGTSVADSSGGSHTGTFVNKPVWTAAGRVNGALTFNGTNSAVNVPGNGSLEDLYGLGMSVAVWIKPASAGGGAKGRILDKTYWALRMGSANTVEFIADQWSTTPAQRTSTARITLNTWQHVVATWNGKQNAGLAAGGGIHIYINGVLADGASVNGAGTEGSDASVPLMIGNSYGLSRGFAGALDEIQIYNRVLTAAEIRALAGAGGTGGGSGDTVAPAPPSSLAVTAASSSEIDLSWTASSDNVGVTAYEYERCESTSCSTITAPPGSSPPVTYVFDAGRSASTPYSYRVRAKDAAGNVSTWSSPVVRFTTPARSPDCN